VTFVSRSAYRVSVLIVVVTMTAMIAMLAIAGSCDGIAVVAVMAVRWLLPQSVPQGNLVNKKEKVGAAQGNAIRAAVAKKLKRDLQPSVTGSR
jgi:hypothetical protein